MKAKSTNSVVGCVNNVFCQNMAAAADLIELYVSPGCGLNSVPFDPKLDSTREVNAEDSKLKACVKYSYP